MSVTVSPTIVPDYGERRLRVGVRVASGAYVPQGTTTAGSVLQIVETGPGLDQPKVTSCVTATPDPGEDTITVCSNEVDGLPGDTLTITQLRAPAGLAVDPDPVVILPCDLNVDAACSARRDVIFNAPTQARR